MQTRPKTIRHLQSKTFSSAIPRSGSGLYLTLSQITREWERLKAEEAELVSKLEEKQQRLEKLENQIESLKERLSLSGPKNQAKSRFVRLTDHKMTANWQPMIVEVEY